MKSNNNIVIAGLSVLCLLLTATCGLLLTSRGGVLGETTTAAAMPRPITTTPPRPSPSAYPSKYLPTPTMTYPTPVSTNNVPCDVITRIYTAYCRNIPTNYPTSIKITPTSYPTKYPTPQKITTTPVRYPTKG